MASIGELFKFLGSNPVFLGLCQQADRSATQIIEDVFQNEGLIASVRAIVPDDDVIKNKMIVVIGQKRKQVPQTAKNAGCEEVGVRGLTGEDLSSKVNQQKNKDKKEEDADTEEEEVIVFQHKPLNSANVIYLDKRSYMERVDHRIRLVTMDYEMYY